MIRAIVAAALCASLVGCLAFPVALPTVAQVCALPSVLRAPLIEAMHSTPEAMALACAVVKH